MTHLKELIRLVALENAGEILAETPLSDDVLYATETLEHLGFAPDDNQPPTTPSGVTVLAGMRALFVNWPIAPPAERVRTTHVRLTNTVFGTVSARKARHQDGGAYVDQLTEGSAPHQFLVEVAHEDDYGRLGAWTPPITATPSKSTVDEVSADRITAGLINAVVGITSGGKVEATSTNDLGNTVGVGMYPTGLELIGTSRYLTAPSVDRGSKITNAGQPFAELYFYEAINNVNPQQGVHVRADGPGDAAPGRAAGIHLEAVQDGNPLGNRAARVLIRGGRDSSGDETFVSLAPHVRVDGSLRVFGAAVISGNVTAENVVADRIAAQFDRDVGIGASGSNAIPHGLGVVPRTVTVDVAIGGEWFDTRQFDSAQYAWKKTDTHITIQNNTGVTRTFRVTAYR